MVFLWYSALSQVGLFMVTAFVNASAIRDFVSNTAQIMFSTPLKKRNYLIGRFAGSTLISIIPIIGVSIGMVLGSWMWWVDAEKFGPNNLAAHVQGLLYIALPNIIWMSAIVFAVASLVRSTSASFITAR